MAKKALQASTAVMAPADEGNGGNMDTTTTGRKRVITYDWNKDTGCLDMSRDKNVVRSFRLSDLNDDIRERAFVHGITQKIADSHAGDIPNAESNADETWAHLSQGDWYAARGESAERSSMFVEAYVRVWNSTRPVPTTVEAFRKIVNDIESGNDDNKKAALKSLRTNNVQIREAMNAIQMERLAARVGDKQQPELESLAL